MKLGDVLRKEREMHGMSASAMAQKIGVPMDEYERIESGGSAQFEAAASLLVNFAKTLGYPGVNGLFYPCGLPFSEVDDYEYRYVR